MNIKQGYKQTEIGIIPEDWEVEALGNLAIIGSGGTPSRQNASYWDGKIPWITTSQIDFNTIIEAEQFITIEGLNHSAAKLLPSNTLLLALYGQGKTRGKVACLGIDAATNQACASISITGNLSTEYLLNFLTSKYDVIRNSSNGGSQDNLNSQIIKQIPILIPPLSEQTAIATALSDIDALIGEVDKLIAKKQGIKQATMQQLLTGKKRLAGFGSTSKYKQTEIGVIPEDWDEIYLSDAVDFLDGKRRPIKSSDRVKMNGVYPYYGASGVIDYVNDYIFDDDLILLGEDGENILSRNLPLAFQVKGKIWVNNHAHVLKPKENFDICFLTNYLESLDYSLHNSGTAQPKLNKQSCLKLRILAPKKIEQTAIANILSDMDAEISQLEGRRAKMGELKQGMMQELLTGRIRLI